MSRATGRAGASGTPDLRAQQKLYTRRRLLTAACAVFDEKGYQATTVDDIAAAAGAARATFYLHFTGKADVVAVLADEIWEDTRARFAAFGDLPDWSHATIRTWLEDYLRGGEENRRALTVFTRQQPHTLRDQHRSHVEEFVTLVTRPPGRWAHFSRPEARRRAYLLITQLEQFLPSWLDGRWENQRSAMLDTLADVWRSTLQADPEKRPQGAGTG
jgi:AcrR family transcriptional regulator